MEERKHEYKYRVKVERIDPQNEKSEVAQHLLDWIECDSFAMLLETETGHKALIHGTNVSDLSCAIAASDDFFSAGLLAKAMRDSMRYAREKKADMADMFPGETVSSTRD